MIQGVLNNENFTDSDKLSAITTICTTFDQGPPPVFEPHVRYQVTEEKLKKTLIGDRINTIL